MIRGRFGLEETAGNMLSLCYVPETNTNEKGVLRTLVKYASKEGREYIQSGFDRNRYVKHGDSWLATKVKQAYSWLEREAAITGISVVAGDLPTEKQRELAKELGLKDSSFTRRSATTLHLLLSSPKIFPLMLAYQTQNSLDEKAILGELALGVGIDFIRAGLAYTKDIPTPAICWKALLSNIAVYGPKLASNMGRKAREFGNRLIETGKSLRPSMYVTERGLEAIPVKER